MEQVGTEGPSATIARRRRAVKALSQQHFPLNEMCRDGLDSYKLLYHVFLHDAEEKFLKRLWKSIPEPVF